MKEKTIPRPPVVAVMGHIDHGKSALLDYIRKTNIVAGEAGGITQHVSAYEVEQIHDGKNRKITFLDTPGHEAFREMRSRGAAVADVAILIVSAEDGVKTQTKEALEAILEAKVPYIVAINKIDKAGADIEKTKSNLLEHEIYLEGLGGNVPFAPISAKTGQGVDDLLDLLLLTADLEEFSGDPNVAGEGVVIESNIDQKKGISATLIIKNGSIKNGMSIVVGSCIAPVRIMENFLGKNIKEASFSSPIRIVGFSSVPQVGMSFAAFSNKKDAEKAVALYKELQSEQTVPETKNVVDQEFVPVIVKADVAGSLDAIEHEIAKIPSDRIESRIIQKGVGTITESDVKAGGANGQTIVVGFNVTIDPRAQERADRSGIEMKTFTIIYELAEWLAEAIIKRTPKKKFVDITGRATVIKVFTASKDRYVVGALVESGTITLGEHVKIIRRDTEVGEGKITALQKSKEKIQSISEGEFGVEISSKMNVAASDVIQGFITTLR